jgi:hypothetical protein
MLAACRIAVKNGVGCLLLDPDMYSAVIGYDLGRSQFLRASRQQIRAYRDL